MESEIVSLALGILVLGVLIIAVINYELPAEKEIRELCESYGCDEGTLIEGIGIQCWKVEEVCYTPNNCSTKNKACSGPCIYNCNGGEVK